MRLIKKLQKFIVYGAYIWRMARPTQKAAALAYYGLMSLPPLLLVMYTVGWYLLGDLFTSQISDTASQVVGPEVDSLLNEAILKAVPTNLGGSWFWAIVGIIFLLIAASGLFLDLQGTLNRIWEAPPPWQIGPVVFIQRRFTAIIMLIGFAVIIILPIRIEYELERFQPAIDIDLPVSMVDELGIYLLFTIALVIIYKVIPNTAIAWRDVLFSSFVVSALVLLGAGFVFYALTSVDIRTPFQVFSLLTLILVSVNLLSLIVVIGAGVSRATALVFGSRKDEVIDVTKY